MTRPILSLSYAQALRAMKRERVDLTPAGSGWSPDHRKWFVSEKNVRRMVENGVAGYVDWTELSDGNQHAMRVKLL